MTKFLLLLSFAVLLGGCGSLPIPCPPPGQPNLSDAKCHYELLIDKVEILPDDDKHNPGKYMITAKVSTTVLDANMGAGNYGKQYPRETRYTFFVSKEDGGKINKTETWHFHREPDGARMIDHYEGTLKLGERKNGLQ